jgi:uncharacterized integral membrane protein
MGRHQAERAPANDMFMAVVVGALILLLVIVVALAAG